MTINSMVDRLGTFAFEVSKVAREVGTEGVLGGQAKVDHVEGKWKDLTDNVNTMAQVSNDLSILSLRTGSNIILRTSPVRFAAYLK